MSVDILPYKNVPKEKKEQIAAMFNNIAYRYDLLNSMLSLGIHVLWRKKVVKLLEKENPKKILDIATGTADFAIECVKLNPDKIIGVDISEKMLDFGRQKVRNKKLEDKIELKTGDSEKLIFEDNYFDAITVGFGVRNFQNIENGLKEMSRVLRKDGTLAILEFSKPTQFPIKQLYHFYFFKVCPFIGKLFTKDNSAYTYLPDSVYAFPETPIFLTMIKNAGFSKVECKTLSFGIASIYLAKK